MKKQLLLFVGCAILIGSTNMYGMEARENAKVPQGVNYKKNKGWIQKHTPSLVSCVSLTFIGVSLWKLLSNSPLSDREYTTYSHILGTGIATFFTSKLLCALGKNMKRIHKIPTIYGTAKIDAIAQPGITPALIDALNPQNAEEEENA